MTLLQVLPQVLTETLIRYIQVPQVDAKIISRNISLTIRIDGDRVDVICMSLKSK